MEAANMDDPRQALYLALDQGGHASRALVFDRMGQLQAKAVVETAEQRIPPDRVEQDGDALVRSLERAAEEAIVSLGGRAANVAAAGLATQRSSIICWDRETGAPLSPVLSWQDRRAQDWLQQFAPEVEKIRERTGLVLSAHYGASKLRWCLDHLPAVAAARDAGRLAMGPLAGFLLFRLLRERPLLVDPSNAGRTLLWNLATADWDDELIRLFGIPRSALPACVPTRHDYGTFTVHGREIPLTVLNGDQSAALFALGRPHANTAYVNLGTGAFVLHALGEIPARPPRLLCSVAWRDAAESVYVIEGTVNGAGSALEWAEKTLAVKDIENQLAGWWKKETSPPLFLNGVSGLGSPFWAADFQSRWISDGTPAAKVVAVAESILFLIQSNLDEMKKTFTRFEQIFVSGGLSTNDVLCEKLANLSGLPVYRPVEHEATARGLAWLVADCPGEWSEAEFGVWFKPNAIDALCARYQRWRVAMPSL